MFVISFSLLVVVVFKFFLFTKRKSCFSLLFIFNKVNLTHLQFGQIKLLRMSQCFPSNKFKILMKQ